MTVAFLNEFEEVHRSLIAATISHSMIPLNVPDLWQQQAVRALREGLDVIVDAPTGAGKTRVFELWMEARRALSGQAVYTVPTRALANDKWNEWRALGWNVGITTGDIAENVTAPVLVATLETQRERILAGRAPEMLVIDEYQMLADARRGMNYELAIALPPLSTQLLLLSGSVRNVGEILGWLERLGRRVKSIHVTERPVPQEEVPVERLPRGRGLEGFWAQLAAGVQHAGLTPLLVFAPRRADVEKIARKLAEGANLASAMVVPPEAEAVLGRETANLLRRGVGIHHSGLPYRARAEFIEPPAKAGKLPFIVATTGLAAGINFSVRSVLIAGTSYQDGPFTRELRPDELLQMFGRAGRRGLDELGHILVARDSPRLRDGAPRDLRRANPIDWPTLLRLMEEAENQGTNGLERARQAVERLFSRQTVALGFETSAGDRPTAEIYGPTRVEFLNFREEWEPLRGTESDSRPLSEVWVRVGERWRPAGRSAPLIEGLGPGRLCKIPEPGGFHYGKEIVVASLGAEERLQPLAWVRKLLRLNGAEIFSIESFRETVVQLLISELKNVLPGALVPRGKVMALQLEVGHFPLSATRDRHGKWLHDPPTRRISLADEAVYQFGEAPVFNPPRGSAARAWRVLGLVDATGRTTLRGRIAGRFQGGEGLMIAAALEDSGYDLNDLVRHLANLRGGHRFSDYVGPSERLAAASRQALGHSDFEGYLSAGVCEGYGEGTSEAIELFQQKGMRPFAETLIRRGDIERAFLEWQSLLRHVAHAPELPDPRWQEFQRAAGRELTR